MARAKYIEKFRVTVFKKCTVLVSSSAKFRYFLKVKKCTKKVHFLKTPDKWSGVDFRNTLAMEHKLLGLVK